MATTKPGQIKIAELDENARLLAVQPGLNEQEVEVQAIRAVPKHDFEQKVKKSVVDAVEKDLERLSDEIADITEVVQNPAKYIKTLGGTVIYVAGESLVINPPVDDPGAVTVDVENENLILR